MSRGNPAPKLDARSLFQEIEDFIESDSDDAMFATGKRKRAVQKWSTARWIQVNTIAPYGNARTRLRKCCKSNEKNR